MASTSVLKSTSLRRAAWHDPADEDLTVSLKDVARLRKLRLDPGENIVGGLEYEGRLRRQSVLFLAGAWDRTLTTSATRQVREDAPCTLVGH
jgi:hypothetical protein